MTTLAAGAGLALAAALVGWRLRALTLDGAAAAWLVGACVFGSLSWHGAAIVFAFFIPAALLSARPKSESRNARQVFANGGVGAACALFAPQHPALAWAFAGAFAAAAADTWATEIGTRSNRPPRSILSGQIVPAGRSGGVSPLGTAAEIAGALVVAATAAVVLHAQWWSITVAGCFGATLDSVLGASLQALYYCENCGRFFERDAHACPNRARRVRGIAAFDNDAVNFVATCAGALAGAALYFA